MEQSLIDWLIENKAKYSIQYADYEESEFTEPALLTQERALKLKDYGIKKIIITF